MSTVQPAISALGDAVIRFTLSRLYNIELETASLLFSVAQTALLSMSHSLRDIEPPCKIRV